jgi:AcrR family transcriptional regulator
MKGAEFVSRNKYPEQSKILILDVAQELFLKQGYEKTTIQNIVDGLSGMTKGVVYHHFKSKKAIWDAVNQRMAGANPNQQWFENWQGDTGLEKLQRALLNSLGEYQRYDLAYSAEVMMKDPKTIGEMYTRNLSENTAAIETYVQAGIKDGSIQTDDGHQLAEFIILTLNLWIGIRFTQLNKSEVIAKLTLLKQVYEGINLPLINAETIEAVKKLYDKLEVMRKKF